jgi:antitoxin component YwqK of YwqJK toxin-antitoxin module
MIYPSPTTGGLFVALAAWAAVNLSLAQDLTLSLNSAAEKHQSGSFIDANATELIQQKYPSGKLHIERQVTLDPQGNYVSHGDYQEWSESGDLITTGSYHMGKQQGVWVRFLSSTESRLFEKEPYRKFKSPFQSTVEFERGKMNGVWTIIDQEGRTVSQIQLVDGLRDGPAMWYLPNGTVLWQSEYREGILDGSFVEHDSSGKMVRSQQYQRGKRIEQKKQYYSNKQIKSEYEYLTASQRMVVPDDWNQNTLAVYEVSGEPVKHGQHTVYYENGAVRSVVTYDEGRLVGKFESWYPNGQREVVGGYRDGVQQGTWNWWHPNGMRKTSVAYQDGKISTEVMAWNDTGLRIHTGAIDEPSRHLEFAQPNQPAPTKVQSVGTGGRAPVVR